MDEEYHRQALECIRRTYGFLCDNDWKLEKVTKRGERISSIYREGYGKIYKLTCSLKYPAKALCYEIYHNIEKVPTWNPTMLESKIIKKINSYTEIGKQAMCSGTGGLIQNRDFVHLCCWRLLVNGEICDHTNDSLDESIALSEDILHSEQYYKKNGRVWFNTAVSIEYEHAPPVSKYVRGENLASGFAACEVEDHPDVCIFEWILCLDLKGYVPRYILDKSYTTFMSEYMKHFHKHVDELRQNHLNK
ncbi:steroidogenic acute regulatory protein-like [Musca domestica]|uniref:Steroidogenic acute regulatory protein-like n=1 Tax=Musca domestica TaxID=7370 RepID=A0A1I8NJR5_MUSDO|nr:steroidogenic acute regulatory protein-like [Musca domestica]